MHLSYTTNNHPNHSSKFHKGKLVVHITMTTSKLYIVTYNFSHFLILNVLFILVIPFPFHLGTCITPTLTSTKTVSAISTKRMMISTIMMLSTMPAIFPPDNPAREEKEPKLNRQELYTCMRKVSLSN